MLVPITLVYFLIEDEGENLENDVWLCVGNLLVLLSIPAANNAESEHC